jgi:hypothetical protein
MPKAGRSDRSRPDAFDQVAANLRQQWYNDGLGAFGEWETHPMLSKLAYLADFAVAMGVSFERFAEAARGVVGLKPDQQFTPEHEWFIAHAFQQRERIYACHRAMHEMQVNLGKKSLTDLKAVGQGKQSGRQKNRDKGRER